MWLDELLKRAGDIWSDFRIAEQQQAYDRHVSKVGNVGLDFHKVREVASLKFDEVRLSNSGEYPAFANYDIYDCNDEKSFVAPRNWWREGENQVAERLVFLTTEQVPTVVARRAMPGLMATSPRMLELGRDPITVTVQRGVRSDHADSVTSAFHRRTGWQIIGNKLSSDIENAMTHARAKGRNDLAEKSIVQTATMFDPSHYRELQALNSWTEHDNLVLLAHIDQINQTGGRNLGFRNTGNTQHRLIINRTLYRSIIARADVMRYLRYAFRIEMGTGQKRKAQEKDRSKLGSR